MKRLGVCLILLAPAAGRAGYVDEVMSDGPAAYYRFQESAGATNAADSSGNGHASLEVSNVVFGATGQVGRAGTFSNAYVRLDLQINPAAADFSIEAFARFETTDTNRNLVSQQDGTGQGRGLFRRNNNGKLASYLGGQNSYSADALSEGAWHHVAMTVEDNGTNDVIRFYLDGQPSGSNVVTCEAADGDWVLGAAKDYANGLIGALDEVAVYTSQLSAGRIADHYARMNPVTQDPGDSPVHCVAPSGLGVYPFTNWTTAARFIQDAVDAAAPGDTVLVTNGTYTSVAVVTVSKSIAIQSVHGPTVTAVDGQNAHRCFNLGSSTSILSGFTIQNGNAGSDDGGGIYCFNTNPVITNCTFVGNSADYGGGIHAGTLHRCAFIRNTAGDGGGCDHSSLYRCTFISNSAATGSGGGGYVSTLRNCFLTGNSANWGGGSYNGTLYHCTLTGNSAAYGGGSYGDMMRYCIVWTNTATIGATHDNWSDLAPDIMWTCTTPLPGGTGNITNAPLLADAAGHLLVGSPGIDAATNSGFADDLDSTPRPLDGDANGSAFADLGAYEFINVSADTDGDGLLDTDEVTTYHSNPIRTDSDSDGRSDGDEVALGYNPTFDESGVLADGRAEVTTNPAAFGLYTSNSITDLDLGGLMLQASNGWMRLNLQLQQCTNLTQDVWTNTGAAVLWEEPAPLDKDFYRVRGH